MPYTRSARRVRTRWWRVAVLLALLAASAAVALSDQLPASPLPSLPAEERDGPRRAGGSAVPAGTTVFDDEVAGVANLDGELLAALRRAATEAAGDGVEFLVDSGWRSPEYQQRLLDEAVVRYGSRAEAARWVATPDRSAHVSGDAVDIGPWAATAWLAEHGARYGLCPVYANEPWHYELRPDARVQECPPLLPDARTQP